MRLGHVFCAVRAEVIPNHSNTKRRKLQKSCLTQTRPVNYYMADPSSRQGERLMTNLTATKIWSWIQEGLTDWLTDRQLQSNSDSDSASMKPVLVLGFASLDKAKPCRVSIRGLNLAPVRLMTFQVTKLPLYRMLLRYGIICFPKPGVTWGLVHSVNL